MIGLEKHNFANPNERMSLGNDREMVLNNWMKNCCRTL